MFHILVYFWGSIVLNEQVNNMKTRLLYLLLYLYVHV